MLDINYDDFDSKIIRFKTNNDNYVVNFIKISNNTYELKFCVDDGNYNYDVLTHHNEIPVVFDSIRWILLEFRRIIKPIKIILNINNPKLLNVVKFYLNTKHFKTKNVITSHNQIVLEFYKNIFKKETFKEI